jgi:prenyltransferase beta subunit
LAAAAGPCNGRGNSLRAVGTGMLSVTMFIVLIKHHLDIEAVKNVFISDNSKLIRRSKVHKQYDEPYRNETLKLEFDVTEHIYRTTTTYGIHSTYKWVRGHQDKNAAYNNLGLKAQLNVDADKYAGDFQLAKGKFRPLVPLLPSCDAMLSIRGISATSNYRKQLIRAYVEPEYIQYLQY